MKRGNLSLFALLFGVVGCAHAPAAGPNATPASTPTSEMATLVRGAEDQERKIAELESRLSLLEQESRELREIAASRQVEPKHAEVTHVGTARHRDSAPEPDESSGPPVVVRLHEAPPVPVAALSLPPAGSAALQLGVAPLPEERANRLAQLGSPEPANSRDDYRDALRLLGERHWDAALTALNRVLVQEPSGPLAANATYWRGEVRYAVRKYQDAMQDFEALLTRFPDSSRVADALLKVGLCHLRLGDQVTAERYFQKVREQYPKSDAARIASREGSS